MDPITEQELEELLACRSIAEAEAWLAHCKSAESIISQVDAAFDGVTLEDGIGLHESNGIDGHAGPEELRRLRESDEKENWRNINSDLLSRCYAAPSFLDAKGLRFHTPAFIIAELRGQFRQDFIGLLIDGVGYAAKDFIGLLTGQQREAIIACIRFHSLIHADCYNARVVDAAIARFSAT